MEVKVLIRLIVIPCYLENLFDTEILRRDAVVGSKSTWRQI